VHVRTSSRGIEVRQRTVDVELRER
jgi:hypothetical protein